MQDFALLCHFLLKIIVCKGSDNMIYDDINEDALYAEWLKDNTNISETEDIKSAFNAGFRLAFKRMSYLMKLVNMRLNASDTEPKN